MKEVKEGGRTELAGEERHLAAFGRDVGERAADGAALVVEEEGEGGHSLAGLDLRAAVDEDELQVA